MQKKILGIAFFVIFLISCVSAITVTDLPSATYDNTQQLQQQTLQVYSKLTDLQNQLDSMKVQDANQFSQTMLKSDLPEMYAQVSARLHDEENNVIMDNFIILLLGGCVLFIMKARKMI